MQVRSSHGKNAGHLSERGFAFIPLLVALGLSVPLITSIIKGVDNCDESGGFLPCLGIAVGAGIVNVFFGTLAAVAEFIYGGVASVLNWAVGNMLSVPVAPHADGITPVVTHGWELSVSLVNAVLLLVLVFIGLATILRLREYELQRTLPRILLIALLVNFSGVFVGFVVDIANIMANFFFSAVKGVSWAVPWPGSSGATGSSLVQFVGNSIGIFLYYLIGILVYLAVIIALILRMFVLWMLAILAPIAFAMYVLPATKGWWNRWLHSLITWAFLPVPIGFFLYLAGYTLSHTAGATFDSGAGIVEPGPITSFLGPFTALFLLFAGISISISLAPTSVRRAVQFGEKAAMVGAGFLGAQALGRYFAREKRKRESGEDTVAAKAERMNFGIDWKNKKLQSAAITAATLGMAPLARFGLRTGIRKGVEYGAKQGQDIEKNAKEYEATAKSDWGLFMQQAKGAGTGFLGDNKRAAMLLAASHVRGGRGINALIEQNPGDFKSSLKHLAAERPGKLADALKHDWDLWDEEKAKEIFGKEEGPRMATMLRERAFGDSVEKDERNHAILKRNAKGEIEDTDAREVGRQDDVRRELDRMESDDAEPWQRDQYLMRETLAKKMIDELKNADIENMNKSVLDNENFRRALAKWKPFNFIRAMGEEWGSEAVEKIQEEAEKIGLENIAKTNRSFLKAAYTPVGELFMRNWNHQGSEIRDRTAMKTFIRGATQQPQPQAPSPPATFSTSEQGWIQAEADERLKEDPTRPLTYHVSATQREYLQNYRPKILQQISAEDAWIRHRGVPVEERQAEIFQQLRDEEGMPKLTPRATPAEKQEFKQIASNLAKLPSELTRESLRKVEGAREVAFHTFRQDEQKLTRLSNLLEQTQTELSAAQNQVTAATATKNVAARDAAQAKLNELTTRVTDVGEELKDRKDVWRKHKDIFSTLEGERTKILEKLEPRKTP